MKCLGVCLLCFSYVYSQIDSCTTPHGNLGQCIPLKECTEILTLLQQNQPLMYNSEAVRYFKRAVCGFVKTDPKVCCSVSGGNDGGDRSAATQSTLPSETPAYEKPQTPTTEIAAVNTQLLPGIDECGSVGNYRLVGGIAADLDEFPWLALIQYQKRHGRGFHCGGVLINKRYVLTAAHCVEGKVIPKSWKLISVRLGEYDTESEIDCDQNEHYCTEPPINVPVIEKIMHDEYNPEDVNLYHDIALLRLVRDVTFTDFINPICLPTKPDILNKDFTGLNMSLAGWGKTEDRSESNIKLKLQLPVKSHSECVSILRKKVLLSTDQLCAGGVKGKDACNGDSGGPLMTLHQSNQGANWFVTGIVSFGTKPCGLEGWPGVYTRVTRYVPWILSKLKP